MTAAALAVMGGRLFTDLVDATPDLAALDSAGTWAVLLPFDGPPCCARFASVRPAPSWSGPRWPGLAACGPVALVARRGGVP